MAAARVAHPRNHRCGLGSLLLPEPLPSSFTDINLIGQFYVFQFFVFSEITKRKASDFIRLIRSFVLHLSIASFGPISINTFAELASFAFFAFPSTVTAILFLSSERCQDCDLSQYSMCNDEQNRCFWRCSVKSVFTQTQTVPVNLTAFYSRVFCGGGCFFFFLVSYFIGFFLRLFGF